MRRNEPGGQDFTIPHKQDSAASLKENSNIESVQKLLEEMHSEFGRRKKIQISGLPPDFTEEVVNAAKMITLLTVLVLCTSEIR